MTALRLHRPSARVARLALLAALALAPVAHAATAATSLARRPAPASLAPRAPLAQRITNVSALPGLASFGRTATADSFYSLSDTFLIQSQGFQDLDGTCENRDWTGTDRSRTVFAHVSDRFVVNNTFLGGDEFAGGAFVYPAPIDQKLALPLEIALNDSARVVYTDGTLASYDVVEVYPAGGFKRRISGDALNTLDTRGLALDPVTKGLFVAYANLAQIFLIPQGGGTKTTFAGRGGGLGSPLDTTAAAATVDASNIATDNAGNVYFAEASTGRVRMIRRNDMRVITLAGQYNVTGFGGDGGPAALATLANPSGVAVDPAGTTLYISDTENNRVRKIDLATGIITTAADGTGLFFGPAAIAYSAGIVYFQAITGDSHLIYKLSGGVVTTAVGNPDFFGPPAGAGTGTQLHLSVQVGTALQRVASDGAGGCYFAAMRLVYHLKPDGTLEVVTGAARSMAMGTRALWFGADSTSAPDEVAHWVDRYGFGGGWGQRLTSPTFDFNSHPGAKLEFDLALHLGGGSLQFAGGSSDFQVEALRTDGSWTPLIARYHQTSLGSDLFQAGGTRGAEVGHVVVDLADDVGFGIAATSRLRVLVRTTTLGTNEDGVAGGSSAGAAVVDNLTLRDGATDLLAPLDFEGGTTGAWTLSAENVPADSTVQGIDTAPTATNVVLKSGFDVANPSCVWTFLTPADSVAIGTYSRIESPWIATPGGIHQTLITFSGRLAGTGSNVLLNPIVRGKKAGDVHPSFIAPSFFLLNSGFAGSDAVQPYFDQRVLRYPDDFQVISNSGPPDSIQIVFSVEDRSLPVTGAYNGTRTRLPFLDDVRVYQLGIDADHDGVADENDACPASTSVGLDADGDGCPDPDATFHHVEFWATADVPLQYRVSMQGDPSITDGSDLTAITNAFNTWKNVPGANVLVTAQAVTTQTAASATDGINLITFQDPSFGLSPSVLAVTPTLSATRRTFYGDRVVLPGQIVDADIVFNPIASFRTPTHAGTYDLQSVATHEIGHFLGLSHSGVHKATMYFVQQPSQDAASLEDDDRSAIAAAYPGATLLTDFGSIRGQVLRDTTGLGVPGALVTAVHLVAGTPADTVASDFTHEDGSFAIFRLPPGDYGVYVTPLDGQILDGLTPENVSARVAASAETNFHPEWYSAGDNTKDDPNLITPLTVAAGAQLTGITVVTNIDTIPPVVASITPANGSSGAAIDASVLVNFSEPIDVASLQSAFKLRPFGQTTRLAGNGILSNGGRTFLFTPTDPLAFSAQYEVVFTSALTDAQGVHLASDFASTFTTQVQPPVAITRVSPRSARPGAIVTLTGLGFDQTLVAGNAVFLHRSGGGLDSAVAVTVTPTSLGAQILIGAPTDVDSIYVIASGHISNKLGFNVLPPVPQATPSPSGSPIALTFAPTDVALAPDGLTAYAVGDGGLATINLDSSKPNLRVAVNRFPGLARSIALSPDGRRAYVAVPADSMIIVVDADPSSATLGAPLDTIPIPGFVPVGLAVDPAGRRLYVTSIGGNTISAIDVLRGSASENHILRTYLTPYPLKGDVTVDPTGTQVVATMTGFNFILDVADTTAASVPTSAGAGPGLAVDPTAKSLLSTNGTSAQMNSLQPPYAIQVVIPVGGTPRDLLMSPAGQSGFIVNQAFNQLQVVNIDPNSATFGTSVAQVGTESNPVAAASNSDGSLIAVANSGSRSISLFSVVTAGAPIIQQVTPNFAIAGDPVVVRAPSSTVLTGAQVDVGAGLVPLTSALVGGGAFTTPNLSQRATSVTIQQPSGSRSPSLPFQVVNPIAAFAPRATTIGFSPAVVTCGITPTFGHLTRSLVSPDGKMVALMRESQNTCPSLIDFYIASDHPAAPIGTVLGQYSFGNSIFRGWSFTNDGKLLWVILEDLSITIINTDVSSPGFLTNVTAVGSPTVNAPLGLVDDPMGRAMYAADADPGALRVMSETVGSPIAALSFATSVASIAVSPDARTIIVGGDGQAYFVDGTTYGLVNTSPHHGAASNDFFQSVAVTSNGKRAIGLMTGDRVAIWNLDASQGAIGAELYFGTPVTVGTGLSSPVAGPDGHSFVFGAGNSDIMFSFDVAAAGAPPVTSYSIGQRSPTLARSADGRRLWVARNIPDGDASGGDFRLFNLSPATQCVVTGGNNQSALAGATLPLPVTVRVIDSNGGPAEGVVVTFATSGANGTLDGASQVSVTHVTDANGEASVRWSMPASGTNVSLSAVAEGTGAAPVFANATIALDDNLVAPVLLRLGPPDGSTGLNAGTAVFANFNQKIAPASAATHVKLFANGDPVSGTFAFSDLGRLVLFQPGSALSFAARCSLVVLPGLTDQEGQTLALGGTSVFTIQGPPPASIASLVPQAGPVGTPVVINGAGFSPTASLNLVQFADANAVPANASLTSMVANAPLAAVSGPVTVTVGSQTSNALPFTILPPNPDPGGVLGDLNGTQGIRDVAVTPDGTRLYITNPSTNSVTVLAVQSATHLLDVTVGSTPQSVAILPDGSRAYVANTGSNDLSIIDVAPTSLTYNKVIGNILVGLQPIDVEVGPVGPKVYVLNQGSNTLSEIDANPGNATFDQVVTTVNTGSGGKNVSISADGTRAYVANDAGLVVVDLGAHQVVTTVNTGSGGKNVSISADGTLVLLLTNDGRLLVIDATPGPGQYRVVTTVNVGSGGKNVSISADGTLAYVTNEDTGSVEVFEIGKLTSGNSTVLPGPPVTLTLLDNFPTGAGASGIAVDPMGKLIVYVVNTGAGTVTEIGFPNGLPPVVCSFDFNPNTLNLKSIGKWVKGVIQPPPPFAASDIVLSSLKLNGVPADTTGPHSIGDANGDGIPDLSVNFVRSALDLAVTAGDSVPVTVTGLIGGRNLVGRDTIRVARGRVTAPHAGQTLAAPSTSTITWTTPNGVHPQSVAVLHSLDHGSTWVLDAQNLPNSGSYGWSVPDANCDSAQVAVVLVEGTVSNSSGEPDSPSGPQIVTGALAVSDYFRIIGTTDVQMIPTALAFAPVRPNPAVGSAVMRFGLPRRASVELEVFDVQGRRTKVLAKGVHEPGWYEVRWDGRMDEGSRASSGLYFVRFKAEGREFKQRLVWMK